MGHPASVAGVAKTMVRSLDSLPLFDDRLHPPVLDRTFERSVVLFILIGIGNRESDNGFVESVGLAQGIR